MRTLKKSLSLVLVLAMVCSFFVMGTSAAFEDADQISDDYVEAVDVLSGLGIVSGMGDGTFAPEGKFNRAQAAVIIGLMLQCKDDDLFGKLPCNFADVDEGYSWAKDFIAYCADLGIIKGYDATTFGPGDDLTGAQFALMLIKALGHDVTGKVTPATYELDVTKLAAELGLFSVAEITADYTREIAAGMAYEALCKGETKTLGYPVFTDAGAATGYQVFDKDADTLIQYCDTLAEAMMLANTLGVAFDKKAATETKGALADNFKLDETTIYDDFGRATDIKYVESAKVANGYTEGKDTVVYSAPRAAAYIYVVESAKVDTIAKVVAACDKELESDDETEVAIGNVVEIYLDADGEIENVIVLTNGLGQIVKLTKTTDEKAAYTYTVSYKVNGALQTPVNDNEIVGFDAETMDKDAYVIVTTGSQGGIEFSEATVVTGVLSAKGTGYIKVAGEKLSVADSTGYNDYENTYDFYLDANGYVVGAVLVEEDEEEVAYDYFYVTDSKFTAYVPAESFADAKAAVAKLAVTYLDGTSTVIDMAIGYDKTAKEYYVVVEGEKAYVDDSDASETVDADEISTLADGFYKYSVDEDGLVASVEAVDAAGEVVLSKGKATLTVGGASKLANASTKVVLIDTEEETTSTVTGYTKFEDATYTPDADTFILVTYTKAGYVDTIYVLGITVEDESDVEDAVYGLYVSTGDTYYDATAKKTYTDVTYNVAGTELTYKTDDTIVKGLAKIVVTDGVAAFDELTGEKVVTDLSDGYLVSGEEVIYLDKDLVVYDVTTGKLAESTGLAKNDVVILVDTITNDNQNDIELAFVVFSQQADGILTAFNETYLKNVLGMNAQWYTNIFDSDREDVVSIIQYVEPKDAEMTVTVTSDDAEGYVDEEFEAGTNDTGADNLTCGILNWDQWYEENEGQDDWVAYPDGTYTITILADGAAILVCTVVVEDGVVVG